MADPATSRPSTLLSQPALEAWGRAIGESAARGELALPLVIALRGTLGAGKSVLARAIARGAGVTSPMPSPTYNLLFTYETDGVAVHHLDLYRLEDPDDVWEIGWDELGQGDELVLLEWPERAESLLPPDRWEVRLSFPGDDDSLRGVRVEAVGAAPVPPQPQGGSRPVDGSLAEGGTPPDGGLRPEGRS